MKTIKRNWLKKQIAIGNCEAKCNGRYTDDYQFDNAENFGKTDWLPARISTPVFQEFVNRVGNVENRCVADDFVEGMMNFRDYDFEGKSGRAYQHEESGIITLRIHSNESYSIRFKN